MFGRSDGLGIWWPEVARFLAEFGLPTEVLVNAEIDPERARLVEASQSHDLSARCKIVFESFLDADYPRAFAVADKRCGYAYGG